MSLFAPRPMEERASVVLPTVTCSSCSAPIPLSGLGEHICQFPPPSRAQQQRPAQPGPDFSRIQARSNAPRQMPKPSQIVIPPNDYHRPGLAGPSSSSGSSFRGPASFPSEPSPSFRRPFANSPGSNLSSPSSLNIPLHNPSPATLSAPSPAFGAPSPRTPSPTNPFFPHAPVVENKGTLVHGLGLGVGKPQGPFPTDAPLPPGVHDPLASTGAMPDMSSGGNAGMAGVGRRAFAAAAWGVRAGVALAAGAGQANGAQPQPQPQRPPQLQGRPMSPPQQYPNQFQPNLPSHQAQQQYSRGPSPQPPTHRGPSPQPPNQRGPSPQPPRGPSPLPPASHQRAALSPTISEPEGPSFFDRLPKPPGMPSSASPPVREPPLLPKAPLANRPRAGTISNANRPTDLPIPPIVTLPEPRPSPGRSKSVSTASVSQPHVQPQRKGSIDSIFSSQASASGSPQLGQSDSISALIRARQASAPEPKTNKAFFDKYKAMVAGSSGSSTPSGTASPMLGFGLSRRNSAEEREKAGKVQIVDSPETTSAALMEDDEDSALPWARPKPSASESNSTARTGRHRIAESEDSSHSSSSSRRHGASVESEEVVTPSASWEGISDRNELVTVGDRKGAGHGSASNDREYLEQIGEEEEHDGEMVVFGGNGAEAARARAARGDASTGQSTQGGLKPSHSSSTITSSHVTPANPYRDHSRSHTAPEGTYNASSETSHSQRSHSRSQTNRPPKVCAKCNEPVGGSRRFVERDGVVLCERDWKKLYLPSCRRCRLPIEKSAVSSSDGQLKGKWHRACFTCTKCDKAFEGDSFYVLEGKPWCQYHYHEENCRKPIEGECILTPDHQRFHPGHLKCDHRGPAGIQSCREAMDEYYELGKDRFCEKHISEALRRDGKGLDVSRAEKRRTRLVDMRGGLGGFGGESLR